MDQLGRMKGKQNMTETPKLNECRNYLTIHDALMVAYNLDGSTPILYLATSYCAKAHRVFREITGQDMPTSQMRAVISDEFVFLDPNHKCEDGSTFWEYDGQGIPMFKVCDGCRKAKLARHRKVILESYNQNDIDQPIKKTNHTDEA